MTRYDTHSTIDTAIVIYTLLSTVIELQVHLDL